MVLPLRLRARGQPFLGQSTQGCLECDVYGDGCGTFSCFPIAGLLMSCIKCSMLWSQETLINNTALPVLGSGGEKRD